MKSMLAPNSQTLWPAVRLADEAQSHSERIREIRESIGWRAYELFEERGHQHGHDLEDWLHAESETLLPIVVKTYDFEDTLIIRAEVPVLTADDFEVSIEPRRITISDKDRLDIDSSDDSKPSKRLFHTIVLPDRIDWASAATAFKDGLLEVEIPKLSIGDDPTVQDARLESV
jgi:HSP20 family molecular chaperone IbpA